MKKNLILYIVAGAVVLAGLVTGGVIVGKKVLSKSESTTEAVTQAFQQGVIPDDADYTVPEGTDDDGTMTDEEGNLIEFVTDKEGKTLQAVIETKANGEVVTKANGEKVTKKPTETKKVAPAATTKAGEKATTKKAASTTKAAQKSGGTNGTLVYNDDGTASIVKSDGTVALNYSYSEAGNYFYTDDTPWQRSLGFNRLYDMGAAFTCMYYDTVRVKYSYGNYDWMIQMWRVSTA